MRGAGSWRTPASLSSRRMVGVALLMAYTGWCQKTDPIGVRLKKPSPFTATPKMRTERTLERRARMAKFEMVLWFCVVAQAVAGIINAMSLWQLKRRIERLERGDHEAD